MVGNTYQQLFLLGANQLASHLGEEYGPVQQAAGFTAEEWRLLTQPECWNDVERRQVPSALQSAVAITLRVAGLPPTPLPGAYVAAVICKLCAPCNRLVAAACAPESYDVLSAVGLTKESQHVITTKEQMYALVTYFSSAEFGALESFRLEREIEEFVLSEQSDN